MDPLLLPVALLRRHRPALTSMNRRRSSLGVVLELERQEGEAEERHEEEALVQKEQPLRLACSHRSSVIFARPYAELGSPHDPKNFPGARHHSTSRMEHRHALRV